MFRVKTKIQNKQVVDGKVEDLKSEKLCWIDCLNPTKKELEELAELTKISAHELNDFLSQRQRPMILDLAGYSIVIFRGPFSDKEQCSTRSIVFLISKAKNDLITLRRHKCRAIEKAFQYSEARLLDVFRDGATTLIFEILDEIISDYFKIFEEIDKKVVELERHLLKTKQSQAVVSGIYQIKKTLLHFRKSLTADRDVISSIEKRQPQFMDAALFPQFRILYNDLTQLVEWETTYRDILTTSMEVHLSSISNYLNITMKRVTAWGAIILVPSLIASIFGMNLRAIVDIHWQYDLYVVLGGMLVSVIVLYVYFKRKDWM